MSGSSGVTNITVSATSTTELVDLVESYTLANDNKEIGMALVQKAYVPLEKYIIFQPNSMSVESSGGTSSLNIQSNDAWEIVSDDWIQLSRYETESRGGYNSLIGDGNTIVGLRFSENTGSSRNGGISGYCKSNSAISATTTIQQSGSYVKPYLALGQYQYNVESSGQSGCSLAVVSNVDWVAFTEENWITINTASGSSDGTISFSVQENNQSIGRRATITVTSTTESLFAECTINQSASAVSAPYITISPTDQTIPLSGGSFTISVSSNTDWDVAVIVSDGGLSRPWISVDKLNGSGDDDVVVTVNAVGGSSEIDSRSAYISFYNNKEGLKTECNIEQREPNLTKIYYTSTGGTVINPNTLSGWGANIISNTYNNGKGVIEFDGVVTEIPIMAFQNKTELDSIVFPEGLLTISNFAFYNTSLVNVVIPDSVTTVLRGAFMSSTTLNEITVGLNCTQFGESGYAAIDKNGYPNTLRIRTRTVQNFLSQDVGLKGWPINVIFEDTVEEIKGDCFKNSRIIGVQFNTTNLTKIYYGAFNGCCIENNNLVLPEGLEYIGYVNEMYSTGTCFYAGNYSGAFTSVTIPSTVKKIGNHSFNYCSTVTDVYCYPTTAPYIWYESAEIFYGVRNGTLHYPRGSNYSTFISALPNTWTAIADL